ncbi:duodenase-1-like [Anableps anableps]
MLPLDSMWKNSLKMSQYCPVHGSDIIHGEKAQENSMQYMVSVQTSNGHMCGGFLISEDFVLTAAHCDEQKLDHVLLGTHNILKRNIGRMDIKYMCKYPTYKSVGFGDDLMLLKLSRKAALNNRVKTIPLPTSDINLKENQICSVAGWGKTENDIFSDDLRVVNVSIINQQICQNQWDNTLPPNVICAGGYGTKKGFCQGDSGGPLVCNGIAVGVVSFNRRANCNYPDVPNVYIDISKYLPWINRNMKSMNCVR